MKSQKYSVDPKEARKQTKYREYWTDGTNRKQQDNRVKPTHINNHIKSKWSEHPNLNADCQIGL